MPQLSGQEAQPISTPTVGLTTPIAPSQGRQLKETDFQTFLQTGEGLPRDTVVEVPNSRRYGGSATPIDYGSLGPEGFRIGNTTGAIKSVRKPLGDEFLPQPVDVAATVFTPERLMELEMMGMPIPEELRRKVEGNAARYAFNPLKPTKAQLDAEELRQETIDNLTFIYSDLDRGTLEQYSQGVLDEIAIRKSMTITKPYLQYKTRPDGTQSMQSEIVYVEEENPDWIETKSLFRRDENGNVVAEQATDLFLLTLSSTGNERAAELYNKLFTIDDAIREIDQAAAEGMPMSSTFAREQRMNMVDELITLGYNQDEVEQLIRQHRDYANYNRQLEQHSKPLTGEE